MTTTPNYNTPMRVIEQAAQDAGLLEDLQDPSPEQFKKWFNRLQDILNFEQTQGLKLWLQVDLTIPLVAGKRFYILGPGGDVNMPKPMRVIDGYYLDTSASPNTQRPLMLLSWNEYTALGNPTSQGALNSVFVNKQATFFQIAPWLVADTFTAANGQMHLIIGQTVTQLVQLTDAIQFPQEWFIFLHWALCRAISTGQPKAITDRADQNYAFYKEALEDFDTEEGTTRFTPDPQQGGYSSRFK